MGEITDPREEKKVVTEETTAPAEKVTESTTETTVTEPAE